MARKYFRSGSEGTFAAAARGLIQGIQTRQQLEQMAAERAIHQQTLRLAQEKEKREARPKALYDPERGFIPVPEQFGDVTQIARGAVPLYTFNQDSGAFMTASGKQVQPEKVPTGSKIVVRTRPPADIDAEKRSLKLNELGRVVDFFESKINEIPTGKGLPGRAKGFGVLLGAKLQTDPKAAAYVTSVEGLRSQIARGLGEVGNLAEKEQEYAINLLPKITDNTETKIQKIQNFRDYIKIKSGGGQPVSQPSRSSGRFRVIAVE